MFIYPKETDKPVQGIHNTFQVWEEKRIGFWPTSMEKTVFPLLFFLSVGTFTKERMKVLHLSNYLLEFHFLYSGHASSCCSFTITFIFYYPVKIYIYFCPFLLYPLSISKISYRQKQQYPCSKYFAIKQSPLWSSLQECIMYKLGVICILLYSFTYPLFIYKHWVPLMCVGQNRNWGEKKEHLPALHKSPSDKLKSFKEFDDSFRGQFYLLCISHIYKYYEVMIICFAPDQGNWISWATDEIDFSKKRTLVSCFSRFFFFWWLYFERELYVLLKRYEDVTIFIITPP